jgi:hypothetical protein
MMGLEPTLDPTRPEYLTHVYRLDEAFQVVASKIAIFEKPTDQAVCDGRDDDGIGFANRLQPRHKVGGLTDRGILPGHALANKIANNNHARADGDAGLHRDIRGEFQRWDSFDDSEAGENRTLRVVLVRGRVPEIREHTITEVLCHHATEGFDLFGAAGVERGYDVALLFGIKACRERA